MLIPPWCAPEIILTVEVVVEPRSSSIAAEAALPEEGAGAVLLPIAPGAIVLPGVNETRELDFCVSASLLMAKPWLCFIYQALPDTQGKPSAIFGFFDIKTSILHVFEPLFPL